MVLNRKCKFGGKKLAFITVFSWPNGNFISSDRVVCIYFLNSFYLHNPKLLMCIYFSYRMELALKHVENHDIWLYCAWHVPSIRTVMDHRRTFKQRVNLTHSSWFKNTYKRFTLITIRTKSMLQKNTPRTNNATWWMINKERIFFFILWWRIVYSFLSLAERRELDGKWRFNVTLKEKKILTTWKNLMTVLILHFYTYVIFKNF